MWHDLVEPAARGEHEVFDILATSAGARLCAVARLILRRTDLVEDAVQRRSSRRTATLGKNERTMVWLPRDSALARWEVVDTAIGQRGPDAGPGLHLTDPRRPMTRPDLRTGNR